MDTDTAVSALQQLKQVLDVHHITFWLEKGTLIGAVRHGEFVPWDNDIDVCVWCHELHKIVECRTDFFQSKFELYCVNGHYGLREKTTKKHFICLLPQFIARDTNYRAEFLPPLTYLVFALGAPEYASVDYDYEETVVGGWKLPLFKRKILVKWAKRIPLKRREKILGILWKLMISFKLYKKKKVSQSSYVETFSTITMYDMEFKIPSNVEQYLTTIFGEGWRIPKHKGKLVTTWRGKKIPMNEKQEYIKEEKK